MKTQRNFSFWILIAFSMMLVILLLMGQSFALINYDQAVDWGLQESIGEIGAVGIAFAKGFAFGDSFIYIPLLVIGIIGMLKKRKWGFFALFGSLAISVYWPLVHLYAIYIEREAIQLADEKYLSFSIILPLIVIYGLWGMWYLFKNQSKLVT